ncbi:hypothetical protein IAU60_001557 [Kwoniella sp. DSM 27419]
MAPTPFASPDYLGYAYAALLALGGLMGFRKGSIMSLVAGGGSGLVAAYGANRVSKNPYDVQTSFYTAGLLFALMLWRFVKSGKVMPAGLVAVISLSMAIRYYVMAGEAPWSISSPSHRTS